MREELRRKLAECVTQLEVIKAGYQVAEGDNEVAIANALLLIIDALPKRCVHEMEVISEGCDEIHHRCRKCGEEATQYL